MEFSAIRQGVGQVDTAKPPGVFQIPLKYHRLIILNHQAAAINSSTRLSSIPAKRNLPCIVADVDDRARIVYSTAAICGVVYKGDFSGIVANVNVLAVNRTTIGCRIILKYDVPPYGM